jgi:hypothetical protein
MPYKNPEDKKRWEREHRQQRNERRKQWRLNGRTNSSSREQRADSTALSDNHGNNSWKTILGLALGVGLLFLRVGSAITTPGRN